jgi:SulP family sulfate permease
MYRSKAAQYEKNDNDRAVLGMGLGNLVAALFGGFGGCGLIPNTLLNASSGGVGYASGFAYAIFSALAVVGCAPLLGKLPMAALAGLMVTVAGNTLQWKESAELLLHAPRGVQPVMDLLAMLATTALCFKVDMGLGVAVGVLLAKLPAIAGRLRRGKAMA